MNKKSFYYILSISLIVGFFYFGSTSNQYKRYLHKQNLENSPYKQTKSLEKLDRLNNNLPPNPYFDKIWELTMDPVLGRPKIENLYQIQEEWDQRNQYRIEGVPGENAEMAWISRGPNNIGGRTKGLMFDPNDSSNNRFFAGGVSGGLFVNDNIGDPQSVWKMINGIPKNLPVSSITYDPNNKNIFYAGTGEIYTGGRALGNGLWRSTDGGDNWENIFGGRSDSQESFVGTNNTVDIIEPTGESSIEFLQASFGPNLPDKPLPRIKTKLIIANPSDGCSTISNSAEIKDKIVLIERGAISGDACGFYDKVLNAQNAGAKAVIVYNKNNGASDWTDDLVLMGIGDGNNSQITIPSVFIRRSGGLRLKDLIDDGDTVVELSKRTSLNTASLTIKPGMFFINDVVVRNNNGTSEIYAAVGTSLSRDVADTALGSGTNDGIYKSTDGVNWTKIDLYRPVETDANGNTTSPNRTAIPIDLEIDDSNNIWASTTRDIYGEGGGLIFRSNESVTSFTLIHQIEEARRTEIEFSADNKLFVLAQKYKTINNNQYWLPIIYRGSIQDYIINNPTELTLPDDEDEDIYNTDFTRGQSSYDLMLEADPVNANNIFVGGINIFKSTNGGGENGSSTNPWNQQTHQWGEFNKQYAHADQHAAAINENDPNIIVFAHDGGLAYTPNGGGQISTRINDYVTTQYYTVATAPLNMFDNYDTNVYGWDFTMSMDNDQVVKVDGRGDVFAGGMQDNGTSFQFDKNDGLSRAVDIGSGDGAATMFSQNPNNKYVVYNYVYNNSIRVLNMNNYKFSNTGDENRSYWWRIYRKPEGESNRGDFINAQALDSNFGIVYSNYGSGQIEAFYNWDDFASGSQTTNKDSYSITGLGANITVMNVSPYTSNSSTLFAGTEAGAVWKISNANQLNSSNQFSGTLTNISSNDFVGSISDVELGKDENHLFVTFYNYGVENIFYSNDGGQTWNSKDGNLPDLPVYSILQSPLNEDEVIIGTDLGVWYTKDFNSSNPSWSQANAGMKDVRITDMDLRKGDNTVFVSTYGLGIYSGKFENNEPSISISPSVNSITIFKGQSGSFNVDYKAFSDFNEEVEFSIDGLPTNTNVTYDPSNKFTINQDGTLKIDLAIDINAETKSYPLTINAVSNTQNKTAGILLEVTSDDIDNDGIKNDVDNCPETANPDQSDLDGDNIGDVCDPNPLPSDTFSLQSSNETCRSSNDGKMELNVKTDGLPSDTNIKFTLAVTGGPSGFSHTPELIEGDSWKIEQLQAATYTVCLTSESIANFEQCFNVVITEPQDLSVLSSRAQDSDIVNLTMSGSEIYTIIHNNSTIKTSNSKLDIELKKGLNIIKVYAEKECQGVYEETIFNSEDILLSPNPARTSSKLWIGGNDKNVNLSMFDNAGRLLWTNENNVPSSRSIDIQVSNLRPGLYYVKVQSETVKKTAKLIKE